MNKVGLIIDPSFLPAFKNMLAKEGYEFKKTKGQDGTLILSIDVENKNMQKFSILVAKTYKAALRTTNKSLH